MTETRAWLSQAGYRGAAAIVTVLFAVAGCAGNIPGAQQDGAGVDGATVEEDLGVPCGDYTAEEALRTWAPQVPLDRGEWKVSSSDTGGYDPCAELSWIILVGDAGPDAYQVMLFRYGAYIQPAADHQFDVKPNVSRSSDNALRITWSGDDPATATFTWVDGDGVRMSGTLPQPPDPPKASEPSTKSAETKTASPPAVPDSKVPASEARPMAEYEDEFSHFGFFKTPSGNIMCEFDFTGSGGCGVLSYMETEQYGIDEPMGTRWWIYFDPLHSPEIGTRGDGPIAMYSDSSAATLNYGERAEFGVIACESHSHGLICWNRDTGHGAHMNREGFETVRIS